MALFRIKLGALPADLCRRNIDEVRPDIEQARSEHRAEQAARGPAR